MLNVRVFLGHLRIRYVLGNPSLSPQYKAKYTREYLFYLGLGGNLCIISLYLFSMSFHAAAASF